MNNVTKKIITVVSIAGFLLMTAGSALALTESQTQAILDLLESFGADATTVANVESALTGEAVAPVTPAVTDCTITSFDRKLILGMSGDDVNCLQIVLNSNSETQLADEGVGSPGNETSYFGNLTKAAVIVFQEKYADEVLASWGLTEGTGLVGKTTRAKLNELLIGAVVPTGCECTDWEDVACGGGDCLATEIEQTRTCTPEENAAEDACEDVATTQCVADTSCVAGEGLTVTLAADTPFSATIVASSSVAEFEKLVFTNGDSSDVKVTNLKLKRMGISDDATLVNIYLFDGYTRLGDESTLSSGYVTFNAADGIFTVPAGESKTVSVRADILTAISGQTVGMKLESADDVVTDASAVNGTFPLTGNLMAIATASSLGTVSLSTVQPSATSSIEATNDYAAWYTNLSVTNQNVQLEYLRLTQIGSISASALDNIRLTLAGTEIATGELVAGTVGQDLIFDLSAAPVTITKGQTKTLKVYADIVGGTSKTMRLGLEKTSDVFLKDGSYGCYLRVNGTVPGRTGSRTINTGTITMTKASDSPSGNIVNTESSVSLAKFNVKANGEEIKINNLKVFVYTNNTSAYSFRNGTLLLDGIQVGNTANILATSTAGSAAHYTTFNIYQKIPAGTTKTLEVKADIYGCNAAACTSNVATSTNTIQVKVLGSTSEDNAQGMISLAMIDAPAATISGNSLTVGAGQLTLVKNSAYGNQSLAPGSDTKIGSYNLMAGAYDTVNISAFTVAVTTATTTVSKLANIYLKYGTATTDAKGTVAASNVFSVTTALTPNNTMEVQVWATIDSSVSSGAVSSTLAVTATKEADGSDISASAEAGQTITIASGLISAALTTPALDAAIIVGQSAGLLLAEYTYSALYEAFTISEAKIGTATTTATAIDDFVSLYLKYKNAAGEIVTTNMTPLVSGTSTFTGMTMNVPRSGSSKLEVYGNVNAASYYGNTSYASSGDQPQITLKYWKGSSGSIAAASSSADVTSTAMLLYKTKPTVALNGGTSGTLTNGELNLYSVNIGADAKGNVGLKEIAFRVNGSLSTSTTSTDSITTFEFWRGSTNITDKVAITDGTSDVETSTAIIDPTAATNILVVFDSEEVITADSSQNYYLKATVNGVGVTGENIQTYILDDTTLYTPTSYATTTATTTNYFIWTDKAYPDYLHSAATADWINGYLVATLPTDTYTLSK